MFYELGSLRTMTRILTMDMSLGSAEIHLFWKTDKEHFQMKPDDQFEAPMMNNTKSRKTRELTINDILPKGSELYWRFKEEAKPSDPVAKKEKEAKPSDPVARKKEATPG